MNEPGVSGALGVPFRFRELESAFGGCITLGSIEIWDSTFFFCGFCRYRSLFPSLLPDSFLMARVMWLLLDNLLLCWFVVLVVVFSLLHGNSGALSFTFLFPPREDCISGHCKLVFLLWSGHGGASTARLKFCLTICVFHRHLHTLVLFLLCLFCVWFILPLPLSTSGVIKHSTSLFKAE
jgi:hypothetical protein